MAAYGNMDKGLPGELVGLEHQIDSRLASGAVPFGGLCFGLGDGEQVSATGETALLGIAARTALDKSEYGNCDCVNVCRTGKIFAVAGANLTADNEVSVNASQGTIVAKTSAADGAKRVATITVANASAESKKVSVTIGDQIFSLTTSATVKSANDVAAAIKAGLEGLNIPFVPTVSGAVVTLTAKAKGVNNVAIVAATNDDTQTLTVAQTTAGTDVVLNPGWFVRSTAEADGLVIVDLG